MVTSRRAVVGTGVVAVGIVAAVVWFATSARPAAPTPWATLETADVHALAFDPVEANRLLFGHHGGLLMSSDGGSSWQPGMAGSDAMNLGVMGEDRLQVAGHEVYMESTDGGITWSAVPNDLPGLDLHAFAADPQDQERAWVSAAGHGLFRTADAGRTWELLDQGNWGALTAYQRDGETVVAAIGPEGLVRSRDGGVTWEPMAYPGAPLAALASAQDGSALYAATSAGIRRSTDDGATWADTGFAEQALALAISASDPQQMAAVDTGTRFYRSFDGGSTWPAPPP